MRNNDNNNCMEVVNKVEEALKQMRKEKRKKFQRNIEDQMPLSSGEKRHGANVSKKLILLIE